MHLHLPPRKASLASWPVPFSKSSVSFKRLGVEFAQKPRGSGLELCLDISLLVVFGERSSEYIALSTSLSEVEVKCMFNAVCPNSCSNALGTLRRRFLRATMGLPSAHVRPQSFVAAVAFFPPMSAPKSWGDGLESDTSLLVFDGFGFLVKELKVFLEAFVFG